MALSKELQIGKAGEHLVCCDLILQGYNAFLADQGLPFDIIVEKNGILKKVQVKTTQKLRNCGKSKGIYRFGTRRAKRARAIADIESIDYFAFVALDILKIAYLPIKDMVTKNKTVKQTVDFKSRRIKYKGRVYQNGTIRTPEWGKHLEDFNKIKF